MAHNGFSALLPEGLESRSMIKRYMDKPRRRVCLRRVCYGILLAIATLVALVGFHTVDQVGPANRFLLSLPTSKLPHYWQREGRNATARFYIEEVISFNSEVLVLVNLPPGAQVPPKESLECRYGGLANRTAVAVHRLGEHRAAVLCKSPSAHLTAHAPTVLIDQVHELHWTREPLQWNASKVAYEALSTAYDVVVFVHGINHTRGALLSDRERLQQFQCVYAGHFEVPVTTQAQEVLRCPHPPKDLIHHFTEKKISVKFEGEVLPSVAYYNPVETSLYPSPPAPSIQTHHLCACTMLYNGAKFLKEWVYYHAHLGVERFFIYDNNSEDNLDEVVATLKPFNVTATPWPWVKTQEAGFSHCSLVTAPECTWMLFTDIDEYFLPGERLQESSTSSSILREFLDEAVREETEELGQVSTFCHNFGPSGLTASPARGVTQGYTCRLRKVERHKSVVLLSAIDETLANVIHHFTLKPGFATKLVRPPAAVINHYKFQVWDEFKTKFHRRAATYVADWIEDRNQNSKDRVPGLGTRPVRPPDWESRYCEVQDYGLRNYTLRVFGSLAEDGVSLSLPWE